MASPFFTAQVAPNGHCTSWHGDGGWPGEKVGSQLTGRCRTAPDPFPAAVPFPWVGRTEGVEAEAQDAAERGTDTQQTWTGHRPRGPGPTHERGAAPETLAVAGPDILSHPCSPRTAMHAHTGPCHLGGSSVAHHTQGHREWVSVHLLCGAQARQQRATPPLPHGGQTSGCGSWQRARHLILPAAQAGRHKRRSREGRTKGQTDKRDQKDGQTY